jgi:hypothetical protein
MNFRLKGGTTVILMSVRKGSPYADRVEDNGQILIYEGHDLPKNLARDPKSQDQPFHTPKGTLTQNGKFFEAAEKYKNGFQEAELVKVYEKIKDGIWVYNGLFELVDAWIEKEDGRSVFKFKLHVTDKTITEKEQRVVELNDLDHNVFNAAVQIIYTLIIFCHFQKVVLHLRQRIFNCFVQDIICKKEIRFNEK